MKSSYNEELVHPYRNSFRNKIRASRQIVLHLNITKFRPNFGSFQQRVPTRPNQPIRTSRVNFEWLKQIMVTTGFHRRFELTDGFPILWDSSRTYHVRNEGVRIPDKLFPNAAYEWCVEFEAGNVSPTSRLFIPGYFDLWRRRLSVPVHLTLQPGLHSSQTVGVFVIPESDDKLTVLYGRTRTG